MFERIQLILSSTIPDVSSLQLVLMLVQNSSGSEFEIITTARQLCENEARIGSWNFKKYLYLKLSNWEGKHIEKQQQDHEKLTKSHINVQIQEKNTVSVIEKK